MKNFVVLFVLAWLAWYGYSKYEEKKLDLAVPAKRDTQAANLLSETPIEPAAPTFACDGRQHCSQMRSCAEATWFIQHCPDTKMDGDNDGIPCEQQFCP